MGAIGKYTFCEGGGVKGGRQRANIFAKQNYLMGKKREIQKHFLLRE